MIHIFWYSWTEPRLRPEEATLIAGLVSRLGKAHFLLQFRNWLGESPLHPRSVVVLETPEYAVGPAERKPFSWWRAVFKLREAVIPLCYVAFCIGALIYIGDAKFLPYVTVPFAVWYGVYLLSLLLAYRKYGRWLSALNTTPARNSTSANRLVFHCAGRGIWFLEPGTFGVGTSP